MPQGFLWNGCEEIDGLAESSLSSVNESQSCESPLLAVMRGGDSRTIAIHSHLDRDDPYSKAVNFFTAPLPRSTKTLRQTLRHCGYSRNYTLAITFGRVSGIES